MCARTFYGQITVEAVLLTLWRLWAQLLPHLSQYLWQDGWWLVIDGKYIEQFITYNLHLFEISPFCKMCIWIASCSKDSKFSSAPCKVVLQHCDAKSCMSRLNLLCGIWPYAGNLWMLGLTINTEDTAYCYRERNSIVQTCLTTITLYHSQIFLRKHQLWLCTFSSNMYSLALPNKGGTLKWCRVHLVPHFGGYSPGGGTLWTIRSFLGAVTKHSSPGGTVWTVSLVFGNFCGTFLTF